MMHTAMKHVIQSIILVRHLPLALLEGNGKPNAFARILREKSANHKTAK